MFQNDFYTIGKQTNIDGGLLVEVKFNPDHKIYQAHFPQNPITPGVMLIEMVKELLMGFYNTPLTLLAAKNVKFLHVVNPLEHPLVDFKIITSVDADDTIKANVSVEKDDVVFAKIVNVYKKI
jgi:3-hydroxyacyl-[acyl-carrier-protein] dehydratase